MITFKEVKAQFQHRIDNVKFIDELKDILKEMEPYNLSPVMAESKERVLRERAKQLTKGRK